MRNIFAIAFLVAMFMLPAALASPTVDPNANPDNPAARDAATINWPENLPGFSDVGKMNAAWVQGGQHLGPTEGVAQFAPGIVKKDEWPGEPGFPYPI